MTARFSVCLVLTLFVSVLFATTLSAQTCTNCSQTQTAPPCAQPCPAPAPTCTQPCPAPSTPSVSGGVSWELYPNAGGIWPSRLDTLSDNKIKAQGIYGLKGGVFFGSNFELEGSFGYLNHFEPSRSPNQFNFYTDGGFGQPSVLGFLYDINFAVNFGNHSVFGAKVNPYLVTGGGGLTTEVRHGSSAFFDGGGLILTPGGLLVPNPTPERIAHDGDTWFTVNYGGGVKFQSLWGPLGVRVDVRGRTLPNFFRSSTSWIEATGGLLFSFGEH
jgi:hypothetical protein